MWAKVEKRIFLERIPITFYRQRVTVGSKKCFRGTPSFPNINHPTPVSTSTNLFDADHSIELPLLAVLLGNMIFSL